MDFLQLLVSQPPQVVWLFVGLIFLLLSIVIPEVSIAALGLAALLTAIVSRAYPSVLIQIIVWGILAVALALIFRGLVPRRSKQLDPPAFAEVSETIPAGGTGEVSYAGSLWRARCQISDVELRSGEVVHVVSRQGNTLMVLPATFHDQPVVDRTL
ncbi:MAG: NfeD family protein [Microcoleus sp. SIO2G3]|nr:NfeD family protein [Microcoleus sp. SIO2G3]